MENKKMPPKADQENQSHPIKKSEVTFDRDKNQTYVPNDESSVEITGPDGDINFVHPNHDIKVPDKK